MQRLAIQAFQAFVKKDFTTYLSKIGFRELVIDV